MPVNFWAVGSDNDVIIDGLKVEETGLYVNNATVTGILQNGSGATVASFTLEYQTGSDGRYVGTVPASTVLTAGTTYTAVVTCEASGGAKRVFYETKRAQRSGPTI
jgi:hypothetical protein